MILEELRAEEPSRLALALQRRMTVVVGLGPERRAWLAAAVADAMAGRRTTLWGVVEVLRMRMDLTDPLVVRATAGVDPVIGPRLWRFDSGLELARDDLWPTSSLPERHAAADDHAVPPGPVQVLAPTAEVPASSSRRRRWRRGPTDRPGPEEDGAPPGSGPSAARPVAPASVPLPADRAPEVPPPAVVPDPPRPAVLDEPGPPVPQPLQLPPRPVVRTVQPEPAPLPPPRPAALDAPPPSDPGPRPAPPVLPPAPAPPPPPPPLDTRLEQRVAGLARELTDRRNEVAAARVAADAIVVPSLPDPAPVAAALAEVERRRADESATAVEARRLAERWAEAESAAAQARTSRVPPWLLESAARSLDDARQEMAAAETEADTDQPLDPALVDRLEAAHQEVTWLEGRRATGATRRRLQAARDAEADLLRQLGLPDHASLARRLDTRRRTAEIDARLESARAGLAEAEAVWAELHAPRNDAAAAQAAAHLAEVWAEAAAFLGSEPADVLEALAASRPPSPDLVAAEASLAQVLVATGVEPRSAADDVVDAGRAWLGAADQRAADRAAAEATAHQAADAARRAQEAERATEARHAEAVADLAAATAALAAQRSAAEVAHRQAAARWREEVRAAEAAAADAQERWAKAVVEHERWRGWRQEAEAAYEREVAAHREAMAVHDERQGAALEGAQHRAEAAWEATVATLRADHERRQAERAEWEHRRAQVEAAWQAELAAAAEERRRLEEESRAAVAALAAWEERQAPAPSRPELEAMLLQRVADNLTSGPAGAVPLVVNDALASLPAEVTATMFDLFVDLSNRVQIVYLTDDPATVAAARSVAGITVLDVAGAG